MKSGDAPNMAEFLDAYFLCNRDPDRDELQRLSEVTKVNVEYLVTWFKRMRLVKRGSGRGSVRSLEQSQPQPQQEQSQPLQPPQPPQQQQPYPPEKLMVIPRGVVSGLVTPPSMVATPSIIRSSPFPGMLASSHVDGTVTPSIQTMTPSTRRSESPSVTDELDAILSQLESEMHQPSLMQPQPPAPLSTELHWTVWTSAVGTADTPSPATDVAVKEDVNENWLDFLVSSPILSTKEVSGNNSGSGSSSSTSSNGSFNNNHKHNNRQ